ncbi:protein YOR302W [Kluyveromyces marxianus]|uniref:Protein YOR302W n=1 Tax=Kluyveromyces marxianus TaxID=4911 RepID=A0ABX6EZW4_KLUMA|nr:protein YOR302W [Kluyveromyces marxianus]
MFRLCYSSYTCQDYIQDHIWKNNNA